MGQLGQIGKAFQTEQDTRPNRLVSAYHSI